MARNKLTTAAVRIGKTIGRAERKAMQAKRVAEKTRKMLEKKARVLASELEKTKRQLMRAYKRLRA